MKEEREINFKDLFMNIALKWRTIIVCMLVFAIFANGFAIMKTYKTVKETKTVQNQSVDLQQYKDELTEDQIVSAEHAYSTYLKYKKMYDEKEEYYENSILMQLDATKTPTVKLLYKVSNCDNMAGLISVLRTTVITKEWCEKTGEELGWKDLDAKYISELFDLKRVDDQSDGSSASSSVIISENDDTTYKVLQINVSSKNKKSAQKLAKLINEEIFSKLTQIQKKYQAVTIELLDQDYIETLNSELQNNQQSRLDSMNSINNSINNLTYNWDENQKKYYQALVSNETVEKNKDATDSATGSISVNFFNFKYILVGVIGGFFLACCWYALCYLINGGLYTSEEMEEYCGIHVLGCLDIKRDEKKYRNSKVDTWIYRIFKGRNMNCSKEEHLDMICTGIKIAAQKGQMHNLYMTSVSNTKEAETVMDELKDRLNGAGITMDYGKSIIFNSTSLEKMSLADGIVLVEQIKESIITDIEQEVALCKKYNISVIGAVVLE